MSLFFIKLAMARGVDGLQIRDAGGGPTFMEKHPWDWLILAKMQGALYLYSLAPPEMIASIQNI